jgi:hypothetical protein
MIEKSSERTLSSLGEHGLFPIMAAMLPAFLRVVWNVASFEHFFRNGYLRFVSPSRPYSLPIYLSRGTRRGSQGYGGVQTLNRQEPAVQCESCCTVDPPTRSNTRFSIFSIHSLPAPRSCLFHLNIHSPQHSTPYGLLLIVITRSVAQGGDRQERRPNHASEIIFGHEP